MTETTRPLWDKWKCLECGLVFQGDKERHKDVKGHDNYKYLGKFPSEHASTMYWSHGRRPCPECGEIEAYLNFTEPDYGDMWQCAYCGKNFPGSDIAYQRSSIGGGMLIYPSIPIIRNRFTRVMSWTCNCCDRKIKHIFKYCPWCGKMLTCPDCFRWQSEKCTEATLDTSKVYPQCYMLRKKE